MPFTVGMLKSIEIQIERCINNKGVLDVYGAAEIVRRENVFDNVALEDIVGQIVRSVGGRCAMLFLPESAEKITESDRNITPTESQPLQNGQIE